MTSILTRCLNVRVYYHFIALTERDDGATPPRGSTTISRKIYEDHESRILNASSGNLSRLVFLVSGELNSPVFSLLQDEEE